MRILLADNNRLFLEAATHALEDDGHEVLAALDGLEALERLQGPRLDCCVLDIIMPRLNGDRLCAYIKADPDLRTIPVILVTGMAREAAREEVAHVADAVLAKGPLPDLMEGLCTLVRRAAAGDLVRTNGCEVVGAQGIRERQIVGELVSTKRRYEALLEHLGEGVIEVDALGRVLSVNRRAGEILGAGEHDLLGRWVGRCLDGPARERLEEAFRGVAGPAGQGSAELALERHGRALHVQLHRVPGEQDDFVVALTVQDVTPLVQAERLRAVAEMAAGVAHDFNNLLTSILGRAEMLRGQPQTPEVARGLEVMLKAGRDGAAIVRRLMTVAKRRPANDLAACDVNQLIEDAVEFTRPRWKGEAQRRGITIEVIKQLGARCDVLGDAGELREVLTNLLLNALDAMPEGGRLTIQSDRRTGEVVVAVSDTGMGMAPEVRQNLFRPYYTTKGAVGTGLGMSIAYAIIERHHGRVDVESAPGRGTTIRLVFPAHEGGVLTERPPSAKGLRPVEPRSILVVDDDTGVRELLAEALRQEGHHVVEAENAQEALVLLERGRFDLLVTDLGMPGMPGTELARRAKAGGNVAAVALITGWGVDGDDRTLQEAGVDLVLNKPFEIGEAVAQLVALARR
ncbi:MAG TPA: response regulator [Candidatus Sulfotelmatobacter sp.]|nr:response regulator [Candidatus Sulfotelmatobacter sp.]